MNPFKYFKPIWISGSRRLTVLLLATSCFFGCNERSPKLEKALTLAKGNRSELEKVLKHFGNEGEASEKYRSAVFLIENMPGHTSYDVVDGFEVLFDSIAKYPQEKGRPHPRAVIFEAMLDGYVKELRIKPWAKKRKDIKALKAIDLIDNINFSYQSWQAIPSENRASFEEFCEFILPYNCNDEPVQIYMRSKLHNEFSWVLDSLRSGAPLEKVVVTLREKIGYGMLGRIRNYCPASLSTSQNHRSKLGLCDDGVNYFVTIFRSLGLVASRELINHWGMHHSVGHSWFYVKYGAEEGAFNVKEASQVPDLRTYYRSLGLSIPKVRRFIYSDVLAESFAPKTIDVTQEYVPTMDIGIDNNWGHSKKELAPVVGVFDISTNWEPVDMGEWKEGQARFKNLGTNVLYLPGFTTSKGMIPINHPFYINKNKEVEWLRADMQKKDSAIVLRKYGLSIQKRKWLTNIIGGEFQASNDSKFKNFTVLHRIEESNTTQFRRIRTRSLRKFKYVRFYSENEEVFLLHEVRYIDQNGNIISGETLNPKKRKLGRGESFNLGIELEYPQIIKHIDFMPRNDMNHIEVGHDYELFYWNKQWISWDRRMAQDTVLHYVVPSNALFWLKDHTAGKEEHVFTLDSTGHQRWLGFPN